MEKMESISEAETGSTSEAEELILRAKDLLLEILQKGGFDMRKMSAFEEMAADTNPGCNTSNCGGCQPSCGGGGQGSGCLE